MHVVRIGNLLFVDSFQFMAASLYELCKGMRKEGVDDLVHTTRYFGRDEICYQEGIYPYDYVNGPSRLDETALSPKAAFYNSLTDKHIDDEQYACVREMWEHLSMKSMRDYTRHYMVRSDFGRPVRKISSHYVQCPRSGLSAFSQPTQSHAADGVELGLIEDSEIYLMVESSIRGGLSYVTQRHARAKFPAMGAKEYRADLPTSHILYLDCNSLYATCQQFLLPIRDFRLLSDNELARFDVSAVAAESPIGYIMECDLKYPTNLHDLHNAYPLAPEHLCIDKDMFSDTHKFMLNATECRHLKCR